MSIRASIMSIARGASIMSISWIVFKTLSPIALESTAGAAVRPNAWTDLESPGGEHHEHHLGLGLKLSFRSSGLGTHSRHSSSTEAFREPGGRAS